MPLLGWARSGDAPTEARATSPEEARHPRRVEIVAYRTDSRALGRTETARVSTAAYPRHRYTHRQAVVRCRILGKARRPSGAAERRVHLSSARSPLSP